MFLVLLPSAVQAQGTTAITSTTGMGNLNTTVSQVENIYNIGGGTRPGNGPNLFHSFGEFSIGTSDIANFANETPLLPTSNILGRVTGGQPSNIFGTIQTIEFPGANLFLMNPAGIVFGPTASLNVSGAVNFTTADYLRLADQGGIAGIFYASPLQSSVLTSAPVTAFGFLSQNPAPIEVQGTTLSVPLGLSLSLIGGNVTVQADPESSTTSSLLAPSGQVRLVSVGSAGEVLSESLGYAPNVNGQTFTNLGTVTIQQGSTIDVTDNAFEGDLHGGTVMIRGGRLVMDSSSIMSNTLGDVDGAATATRIEVTDDVVLQNLSMIQAATGGGGRTGDVEVTARRVEILSGSSLGTFSLAGGQAGNVKVTATESITVAGADSSISSQAFESGDGGSVSLAGPNASVNVTSGGAILTRTNTSGRAGDLSFDVANVTVSEGSAIRSFGGDFGASGHIRIKAADLVSVTSLPDAGTISVIMSESFGEGGNGGISIEAGRVLVAGGSRVRTETRNQEGGRVQITARDSLMVIGPSFVVTKGTFSTVAPIELSAPTIILDQGIISTVTVGDGDAGPIAVQATNLTLTNGGRVQSSTQQGIGRGGDITLRVADKFSLSGEGPDEIGIVSPSGIYTSSQNIGTGDAGHINVSASTVEVSAGARFDSSTVGIGRGGDITIQGTGGATPANSILMTGTTSAGKASGIYTNTEGTGAGGNISVNAQTVTLENFGTLSAATSGTAATATGGTITVNAGQQVQMNSNALISSSSTGPGNAGDILVSAGDSIFLNASQITTEALQASGGNITLMAPTLIQFVNSTVSSSVQGSVQTIGGNITIDPQLVTLQNSQIIAQAFEGQGGNINITAGLLLLDGTSKIDASSQFGVSGTVSIQSPISNLSQVVNPLQRSALQAATLLLERCAVRAQTGNLSSLTVRSRDVAPAAPGGMLSGPLLPLGPSPAASGASPTVMHESKGTVPFYADEKGTVPRLPILKVSGELMRPLAQQVFGTCGS